LSDAGTQTAPNPAAPAAPAAGTGGAPGVAGGGAADPVAAFLAQVPDDIRGEVAFKDIKDVPNLARSYFNAQKMIGAPPDQVIRLAGPDDKPGWDAIWNRLGRPEAADKYTLTDPEKPPPGLTLNPELKTAFAAKAHELGLGQKQADALYQWYNGTRIEAFSRAVGGEAEGLANAEKTLKSEWGAAYDQKLQMSEAAVAHLDQTLELGGGLVAALKEMPAASRVALGKVFAHLGGQMREDGVVGRAGGGIGDGALSPAEAMQQVNAMFADPQMAKTLMDPRAPGHADAVAKQTRLMEFAAPNRAA
jgi:hypothetical protein